MKALIFALALASGVAPSLASDGGEWSYIAASSAVPSIGSLEVPRPLDETAVRLVAGGPPSPGPASPAAPVVSVPVAGPEPGATEAPPGESKGTVFPPEARWPDARGRISAPLPVPAPRASGIRNPWDVRVVRAPVERDTALECGGTIVGGEGGPVAILNGRNVRRGDALGEFRVANVRPEGVLLERRGAFFVIPNGRHATVATAGD